MNIQIRAKNFDLGASLRQYIENQTPQSLEKYFASIGNVHVTCQHQHSLFQFELRVMPSPDSEPLSGQAKDSDPYHAFNKALVHLSKKLRRLKRRLVKDRRHPQSLAS